MKKALAAAKKLLKSKDPALVRQGVQLALADAALRDALLEGVTFVEGPPGFHRVVPGKPLEGPSTTSGGREYALLALLKDAGRLPQGIRLERRTPNKPRREKGMLELFHAAVTELELPRVSLEELPVAPAPYVHLEVAEIPADWTGVHALTTRANEFDIARLKGFSGELHLHFEGNGLPVLPGLRSLEIEGAWGMTTLEPLRHSPQLERLRINGAYDLRELQVLSALPALRELRLAGTDVDRLPIGHAPLEVLELRRVHRLKQIDDLEGSPGLRSLVLEGVSGLKRLPQLPRSPGITRLELTGAPITDVSPLRALPDLEWLRLDVSRVRDVSPLADLPALTMLDLRYSRVKKVDALAGLTRLRCLALGGTGIEKNQVPEPIQRWVTTAKSPNLAKMAARDPEAPRHKRLAGASGKRAAAAGRMLKSKDAEVIQQGLELLLAVGDPAVVENLLQDVTWKENKKGLEPASNRWAGRRCAFIVLGLLALFPQVRPDLRDVTHLRLTGRWGDAGLRPVDLASLAALPKLEILELKAVGPLLNADQPVGLPQLKRVQVEAPMPALDWVREAPKLLSVRLDSAGKVPVGGLNGAVLTTLDLRWTGFDDLALLKDCPRLRAVRVRYARGTDLSGLAALPHLKKVTAPGAKVPDLPGVDVRQ